MRAGQSEFIRGSEAKEIFFIIFTVLIVHPHSPQTCFYLKFLMFHLSDGGEVNARSVLEGLNGLSSHWAYIAL